MSMTDPIASFLTRIRNAQTASHEALEAPATKTNEAICKILKQEGYILDYMRLDDRRQGLLRVELKYVDKKPSIKKLDRVSRPGRRVYCSAGEIPRVLRGLGVAVISTSKGIVTDKQARALNVGGEVLCSVY